MILGQKSLFSISGFMLQISEMSVAETRSISAKFELLTRKKYSSYLVDFL